MEESGRVEHANLSFKKKIPTVNGTPILWMRSARIPLSTCEFCDARGTHVQVYKQALEPYPKTTFTRSQRVYRSSCDVYNMCVPTYSSRSCFEMFVFRGGEGGEGETIKGG